MAIYLVQHGKCRPKTEDPQKSLSQEGIDDVRRIAQVASGYGVRVGRIVHSGKLRASQTADILSEFLKPKVGTHTADGIQPLDDVTEFADTLDIASNDMIVGHLPFLEKLAAYLVTRQDKHPVFQLQNGGILCLDRYDGSERVVVKWALMPKVG